MIRPGCEDVSLQTGAADTDALFACSRRAELFERLRIPYAVYPDLARDGVEEIRCTAGGPALFWLAMPDHTTSAATIPGVDGATPVPLFAHIAADALLEPLLSARGDGWSPVRAVTGADGAELGSIWQSEGGSLFLPFDPDQVIVNYLSERYVPLAAGAAVDGVRRRLMTGYYRMRPALPRALQIWLRRRFARMQMRARFPRWPVETGLHDFLDLLLALVGTVATEPIPYVGAWPGEHRWALVLTHDVERAEGWAALDPVLELERAHALRSSWNLVPRRYAIDAERIRALVDDGFEVGVHGLDHDGRDLASAAIIRERLPAIRDAAERWGSVGFRAPAMQRRWEWMPTLGFDYDSSCPDTDPFEPQPGGCCTWLPFFNQELVVLPVTLVQDHTLFVILRRDDAVWFDKAEFIRERGGLALIDTHPDYLVDARILAAYGRLLARYAADGSAWKALPCEVSAWWRRRADTRLERDGDGWRLVGSGADEGRIELYEREIQWR